MIKKIFHNIWNNLDLVVMWVFLIYIVMLMFKYDNLKIRVFNLENEVAVLRSNE